MEVNYKEVIWRLTVRRLSAPFFGKSLSLFYKVSIAHVKTHSLHFTFFFLAEHSSLKVPKKALERLFSFS